jgi:SAM-dependent methyltransferase
VQTSAPLYQSIPWLAVRAADGSIHHVEAGLERVDSQHWRWTPPDGIDWEEAAFAGSTDLGASAVATIARRPLATRGSSSALCAPSASSESKSIWHHSTLFLELCVRRASGALPETDSVAQALELLAPHLEPGMRVLDAGCAAGHAYRSLSPLGVEYHGIDSCGPAIEIGRRHLAAAGLAPARLRPLRLEDVPRGERYDAVICLNTLLYFPMYHEPLDILTHAADRWLVVRSSFGERTEVRYLPDVLLEPGFQDLRAYFSIFGRDEIAAFLEAEGFRARWIPDRRQQQRFGGQPEVVGGIELPAEFLFAERVRPRPSEEQRLGDRFAPLARAWRDRREGGPTGR